MKAAWLATLPRILWLAALALHGSLPLHSDLTTFVLICAFPALLLAQRQPPRIPTGYAAFALAGAALMFAATVVATALHPETIAAASRIVLWAACLFSGMILGRELPGHRYVFLGALAASLLISGIAGFAAERLWPESVDLWQGDRLKLFAIHPSRLAQYCAVAIFWSLQGCVGAKSALHRVAYGVCLVALSSMFFLTNTRAMLFALAVALLCLLPAVARCFRKRLLFILACLIAAGGASLVLFPDAEASRRLYSVLSNPLYDPTYRSRLPIWEAGWTAFTEAPLFGHGIKSFRERYEACRSTRESEWRVRFPGYEPSVKHAHNIFLGRLVETGLAGCLGFMAFFCGVMACALCGPQAERWIAGWFLFFLLAGLMDDPLFRVNDSFVFFAAGSVLGGAIRRKDETPE